MIHAHEKFRYTKGLHDIGQGAYAWLQPDGGWGWSNSGMVVDGDQSLIIDTLFDVPLTQTMLKGYRKAEPKSAKTINVIVNTHHNGDHCNGNCCCPEAKIYAHRRTVEAMQQEPPSLLQGFLKQAPDLGELGAYITSCFGPFDFGSVTQRAADEVFDKDMNLKLGDTSIDLIYVGPAHTPGDVLVHVPDKKIVYTGDILFIGGHPIIWDGPVQNWLDACDKIITMDVDVIVPGHGPITTKAGVQQVSDYLAHIRNAARRRYEAGLSFRDAAYDIALDDYDNWGDAERIIVNCATLYKEFGAFKDSEEPDIPTLFGLMAEFKRDKAK